MSENLYIFSYLPRIQVSSLQEAWQVVMDMKKALLAFFFFTDTTCYQTSQFSGLGGRVYGNEYYLQGCWQGSAFANVLPESTCRSNLFVCLFIFYVPVATMKYLLCHQDGIAKICWFENFFPLSKNQIFFLVMTFSGTE